MTRPTLPREMANCTSRTFSALCPERPDLTERGDPQYRPRSMSKLNKKKPISVFLCLILQFNWNQTRVKIFFLFLFTEPQSSSSFLLFSISQCRSVPAASPHFNCSAFSTLRGLSVIENRSNREIWPIWIPLTLEKAKCSLSVSRPVPLPLWK